MDLAKVHLHWRVSKYKGKTHKSYSLARSYRDNGKVRKEIVYKLGSLTDNEVNQWRFILSTFKNPSINNIVSNNEPYHDTINPNHTLEVLEMQKKKVEYADDEQSSDIFTYEQAVQNAFTEVIDVRAQDNLRHPFYGTLLIILAATLAGCTAITHIYEYSKTKKELFNRLIGTTHCPSYMTFWWLLTRTNSEALNQAFTRWIVSIAENLECKVIAIDGKRLRGAKNNLVHYVSAYECTRGFLLGQVKTEEKSNEITAIPELLKVIDVKDAIVTIDAAGCQKTIVKDIRDRGGHYLIALKGNQGMLQAEAMNFFTQARDVGYDGVDCDRITTTDRGHGRVEIREITITHDLQWLDNLWQWQDLNALIEVKSTRTIEGKTSEECRYYISSKKMNAMEAGKNIRSHWAIENQLHWVLDVVFCDDVCRANIGHAAENLGLFRRMAYSLLKQDPQKGQGLASKQRLAMWEESYVLYLLTKFIKEACI